MAKDFYFHHDCNARNDIKLKRLAVEMGMKGIGIYWCLIEMLYENNGEILMKDVPIIAKELSNHHQTLMKVIQNYNLFSINTKSFTSLRILKSLEERKAKSDSARDSALARWKDSERNANAMPTQSDGNASIVENSIVENSIEDIKHKPIKKSYGEFNNVLLTDEELLKLKERFPNGDTEKKIENLSQYIASHGKKYHSHYATILNWAKDEAPAQSKKGDNHVSIANW